MATKVKLIETGAVTGNIIPDGGIATGKLADDAVTTIKISDANITHAKLHTSMDLTGKTVTVATASGSTNTTAAASTAFVQQELTTLIGGAPSTLNDLNELAAAINDDANYNSTLTTALATKLPLAGGTMTGALTINSGTANTGLTITSTDAASWLTMTDPTASLFFGNTGGEFALWTGGSEAMRVDGSGNVGIGTSSPSSFVESSRFVVGSGTSGTNEMMFLYSGTNTFGAIGFADGTSGSDRYKGIIGYHHTGDEMFFSTNGGGEADRDLTISSLGNVGIGTDSPAHKLDVLTSTDQQIPLRIKNSDGDSSTYMRFEDNGGQYWDAGINYANNDYYLSYGGTLKAHFTNAGGLNINGTGNSILTLNIGTTAGNYSALNVGRTDGAGTAHITPAVTGGVPISGTAGILLGSTNGSIPAVGIQTPNSSNGHIVFNPKGSEKVRITADGDVGIGTTNPKRPLQIGATNQFPISFNGNYPDIHFNTYYESGWRIHTAGFGAKTTFNGATGALVFSNVASAQSAAANFTPLDRFAILANGNVGIGTSAPASTLDVKGALRITRGVDAGHASEGNWNFSVSHEDANRYGTLYITPSVSTAEISLMSNKFRFSHDGYLGIGVGIIAPTAKITLADHTTAAGGIKFRTASSSVSLWSSGSGNLNTDKSFNVGSRLRLPGGNSASDPDIGFNGASSGTGFSRAGNDITFITAATERMRISGAEVYVGHTGGTAPWAMTGSAFGISLMGSGGFIGASRSGAEPLLLNRTSSSGPILNLRKDGTTIGAIGVVGGDEMYIASAGTTSGSGLRFQNEGHLIYPTDGLGDVSNGDLDLGNTSYRFKDIYLYREAHVGSIAGSGQVSIYTNDISNGENNGLKLVNTNASTGTTWHITPGLVGQNNHTLTIRNGVTNVNALEIQTNGVATFAGDVTVNGDVQMASGRGISFTASGNASGMTSELLDDYEEGTWTPAFSAYSGTQPTLSQTGSGTYTKIGRQVTVHGTIAVNSISGVVSGLLKIQNLPFGVVTTNTSSGSFASNGLNFARTGHQGLTCIQNTSIGFLTQNMASSWGWEALSILSAGDEIRITFVYETA